MSKLAKPPENSGKPPNGNGAASLSKKNVELVWKFVMDSWHSFFDVPGS